MNVHWTWALAGRLAAVVAVSCLAAFGAIELALGLHLSTDVAALTACAVGVAVFMLVDK